MNLMADSFIKLFIKLILELRPQAIRTVYA